MFFRRGVAEDVRWLRAKLWLFSIGALLALLGMFMESDWLIGTAGLLLAVGLVLRFVGRAGNGGETADRDDDGETSTYPS